jgi:hypothetical protein
MMLLAGAVLIATLSACGGGSGAASIPQAAPTATAAAQSFAHPQALPPVPTLPWVPVIVPVSGQQLDDGGTYMLASAVPVYNIGTIPTVGFTFVPNTAGYPVAVQVGTTTTFVSPIVNGANEHEYVNGKTAIVCGIDDYDFNEGAFPSQPVDNTGITNVDYFACAGYPFI